jgi:two-component system nitrogen regulation response regulator GlnG
LYAETRPPTAHGGTVGAKVPALTILGHPDAQRVGERALLPELAAGRPVRISRLVPELAHPGARDRRPLAVSQVSRRPLEILPAPGGGVHLLRCGAPTVVEVAGGLVGAERIFTAGELDAGIVLTLANRVVLLLHRLTTVSSTSDTERGLPDFGLVGESDAILELRAQIRQVADLDVPILLRGETGTGKEVLARAIHQAGSRRAAPYFALNMAAIPATLAAAELFGAAKGAFTGADRRRLGYFSRAHGGTLFLDEIGEMPADLQPLLLRALENGEIQPVGGEETLRVDVRILAATDANLEAAIEEGRFRAPLLHRLSGFEIRVPPLRERRDDIGRLFIHFLREELAALGEAERLADPGPDGRPWLPAFLMARLAAHPLPGNVRQLRNLARRLAVGSRGAAEAQAGPLLEALLQPGREPAAAPPAPAPRRRRTQLNRSPAEVTDGELLAALRANRWEPGATARQLGISRPALYLLIDACPQTRKAADLDRSEIEQALAGSSGRLAELVDRLEVSAEGLKRRMKQLGLRRE